MTRRLFIFLFPFILFAEGNNTAAVQERINTLEKPLYTPFVESYILNEIKALREENRNLKVEMQTTLAQREVSLSNSVVNYATSTVNNMFYIIAVASSFLLLFGWSSIREINEKLKHMVDEKVSKIVDEYEQRMESVEKDLEKRSKQVIENRKAIEKTNMIHSLWLRAAEENTPNGKLEIYDDILELRSNDVEALTYKAEAVLDLGEVNWALNLTNQALEIDANYANALYQRAKVHSVLGNSENAIRDLTHALQLNEQYIEEVEEEERFQNLTRHKKFKLLMDRYASTNQK